MKINTKPSLVLKWLCLTLVMIGDTACLTSATSPKKQAEEARSRKPTREVSQKLERIGNIPSQEDHSSSSLYFLNAREGWLSVDERLWHTETEGITWELIYSMPVRDDSIIELKFLNSQVGWALMSGKLHKTEDGGHTWSQLTVPFPASNFPLLTYEFLQDGKRGWATAGIFRSPVGKPKNLPNSYVSSDGRLLYGAISYTEDGGNSWTQQDIPLEVGLVGGLRILDANHGWALSDTGVLRMKSGKWTKVRFSETRCGTQKLLQTMNTGSNGDELLAPASIHFIDDKTGWVSFTNGYLARSTDGGQTWCSVMNPADVSSTQSNFNTYFNVIHFRDSESGWALDGDGGLYETKDGGATWNRINADTSFNTMYFLDAHHGWVVSKEGLFRIIL